MTGKTKSAARRAAAVIEAGAAVRNDGLSNVRAGLGLAGVDRQRDTTFAIARPTGITQDQADALYSESWIAARGVDVVPEHLERGWIEIEIENSDEPEIDDALQRSIDRYKAPIVDAVRQARLSGGALVLLGIDDGGDTADPVNFGGITAIRFAVVVDAFEAFATEIETDPLSPFYASPRRYSVSLSDVGDVQQVWHASRVLRFDGVRLNRRQRRTRRYWGDSILNRALDAVR